MASFNSVIGATIMYDIVIGLNLMSIIFQYPMSF